jgi:hypothetical protein
MGAELERRTAGPRAAPSTATWRMNTPNSSFNDFKEGSRSVSIPSLSPPARARNVNYFSLQAGFPVL